MKNRYLLILCACLFQITAKAQLPKMYINLVSHNEENYTYVSNPITFLNVRPFMLQMAQLSATKGAKWHLGSDHILLRSVIANDVAGPLQATTGGMNILKYITQTFPNNVECDPHAHESLFNYADVAKLHDSLGVNPGLVMSGFLYNQLQGIYDWQDYQNPRAGTMYPNYTWAPKIIWGAATPAHVADPQYYGMWKPTSMASFFNHQASNHLQAYGQGCKIEVHDTSDLKYVMAELRTTLNAIQTGAAPADGFYCTSIFFRESYLSVPTFVNTKLAALMDSINVLVVQNKVEWKFIPEVATIWETTYAAQPFIMNCDLTMYGAGLTPLDATSSSISPNPFTQSSTLHTSQTMQDATLLVYDIYGHLVRTVHNIQGNELKLERDALPSGVYFAKITEGSSLLLSQKIIILD
jgi:hypothetical protein